MCPAFAPALHQQMCNLSLEFRFCTLGFLKSLMEVFREVSWSERFTYLTPDVLRASHLGGHVASGFQFVRSNPSVLEQIDADGWIY